MKIRMLGIILAISYSLSAFATDVPARTPLCKSLRVAGLIEQDKKLILPTTKLSDADFDHISDRRVCLKSYAIGFPGGEPALVTAKSTALKADLQHLHSLFDKAKHTIVTDAQMMAVMLELAPQRDAEFQQLNEKNRDIVRLIEIQKGHDREQMILWGNNFYLRQLYREGKHNEVLHEIAELKKEFNLQVAPLKIWDNADEATFFSTQALKNMIAITEFKAKAELAKKDKNQAKQVLEEFGRERNALVHLFAYMKDDPTEHIRQTYCSSAAKGR